MMSWFKRKFNPKVKTCPLLHNGQYFFLTVNGKKDYWLPCCQAWYRLNFLGDLRLRTPEEIFRDGMK